MAYEEEMRASISATETEARRLAAWFRTFDEGVWTRPSYCPDWDVAYVVGHLTVGAEFFASCVRNGVEGKDVLPFGAKDRDEFMKIRTAKPIELSRLSREDLIARFESQIADMLELFRSLESADFDKPAWHRRGVFPVRRFVFHRLYELIIHEWDIKNDPAAPLGENSLDVAAGNIRMHFPLFFGLSPVPGLEGVFRFETRDTGHVWAMRVGDEKAEDISPEGVDWDTSFSASAGDFILLMTGRGEIPAKEKGGEFKIEGDRAKADAIIPKLFISSY